MKFVTVPAGATAAHETIETPAGEYHALWVDGVLVFGILGPSAKASLARFVARHGLRPAGKANTSLRTPLANYFAGKADAFGGVKAGFLGGTPFQRDVWKALASIAFGKVDSYAGVAGRIGRPGSARPVGQAVGANPLTIVLPCHRVVGTGGALTGFGCGLPAKRVLLRTEGWTISPTDSVEV